MPCKKALRTWPSWHCGAQTRGEVFIAEHTQAKCWHRINYITKPDGTNRNFSSRLTALSANDFNAVRGCGVYDGACNSCKIAFTQAPHFTVIMKFAWKVVPKRFFSWSAQRDAFFRDFFPFRNIYAIVIVSSSPCIF